MKSLDSVAGTLPMNDYFPGPMERFGRRIKLEYVGMASVYAIIALLFLSDFFAWYQTLFATLGAFFLFLGLKKKTEDHLMGSLVLFAASGLAFNLECCPGWLAPYMLLGMTVFVMEGYLERRPLRIYALPVIFLIWAVVDPSWWLGWVFATLYLTAARADKPHLRGRLALIAGLCLLVGLLARAILLKSISPSLWPFPQGQLPLDSVQVVLLFLIGIPALLCLAVYWQKLALPHRFNTLFFGFLAPWDGRTAAMFGMQAAILLTATVFRDSVNTPAWRPFFKHLEWHYFWYVLALAIGLFVNRVLPT
jgi:hypothetical protein